MRALPATPGDYSRSLPADKPVSAGAVGWGVAGCVFDVSVAPGCTDCQCSASPAVGGDCWAVEGVHLVRRSRHAAAAVAVAAHRDLGHLELVDEALCDELLRTAKLLDAMDASDRNYPALASLYSRVESKLDERLSRSTDDDLRDVSDLFASMGN